MLQYPQIDPVIFQVGSFGVRWYGVMYLVGFFGAWLLGCLRTRKPGSGWTPEQLGDLFFYGALGVIIGGRTGYMLFYDFPSLIANPLIYFKVWQGGMSFHGGFLGVLLAAWVFARKNQRHFVDVMDFVAPLIPVGLATGRIGNFINGELFGTISTVPWAMVFPNGGPWPRHPSQLYEFFLEGVALFLILWIYSAKPRPRYAISALFLIAYSLFRIFVEFFREPDAQYGYLAFDWLTMGQLLSLPMLVLGIFLMIYAYRRPVFAAKPGEI